MLFELSIAEFAQQICAGEFKSSAIDTAARVVGAVSSLMRQRGLSVPDEETFKEYHEQHPKERNVTKPVKELLSRYFEYLKGDANNMNEDNVIESVVVESEPPAETPTRGRPGRKPNPDKADRVQVSIYLPRGVYEDIKDIAAFSNSNISDISCELIKEYTLSKSEMLKQARTFLQTLNFR